MNLKEFTKKTIKEIVEGVDEISSELSREVKVANTQESRSVEFDVAVTTSSKDEVAGNVEAGAEIKVVPFLGGIAKGNGSISNEEMSSTITRIKFGVNIDSLTKTEHENIQKSIAQINRSTYKPNGGY